MHNYHGELDFDLSKARRAHHTCDLNELIDISTATELPVIIQNDSKEDIGIIDKTTLLRGIRGGKV